MPGRTSRVSFPPEETDPLRSIRRKKKTIRTKKAVDTDAAAAGPEPMTPRSSDEEADRPRFVAPEDKKTRRVSRRSSS